MDKLLKSLRLWSVEQKALFKKSREMSKGYYKAQARCLYRKNYDGMAHNIDWMLEELEEYIGNSTTASEELVQTIKSL